MIALSLTLATVAIGLSWASPTQAQFKPPNRGVPKTTAGGATRSGSCIKERTPLTVLVPSSKIGLTTESHPTVFLYLPKTTAQAAEFVLKDVDDNDVYRTPIVLPGKPGVVSFRLPADAAPLEVGKDYQWFFNVVCQPNDRLRDDFVTAWIQRIEPNQSLTSALKTAVPRKRPNIYAQAGIWQDTLTTLSELRRTNPTDRTLTNEWSALLKSVGLGQIPGDPTVGQLSLGTIKPR
ncbi:MAG: DUF928 domain-containing protein [Tildeniella nuda ZEHNDER 1965/U140]|nr:DUF928 domain-containing protein [Tildeniella nuda ZEHNDER 1965/U140]